MTEQDIFVGAVELTDPAARAAYLDRACGGDPALRRRVAGLMGALGRAGDFLQAPAAAAGDPEATRGFEAAGGPGRAAGDAVGPYALLELLGEGGMGAVWAAEQRHPVRRKVALKLIKPGMDSRQVLARFEQERQALALMDHPHIARVLDAGAAADGRPYFAMELVRGLPVTDYCDRARLPVRGRLALFADVCRAVQHAHQKGVIHRDLKPSNVLVTVIDGRPVPKVIDFGIAKATGGALTDRTLHTGHFQMVGTPLYMAPEQAELSGVDIDTRADVYALGVLLYELLTGTTPFDPAAFRKAGYDEMRRIIREDEPARPSRRVSTLAAEQSSTVADRRGVDARRLGRLVRGELDWLAMRCLEKDRARRYQSPAELAADVERYLAGEAVAAVPPSAAYRLRKLARRNWAAVAAGSGLAVVVVAVAGTLGWGARDATARRWAAEQAAMAALEESADHYRADRPDAALAAAKRAVDVLAAVLGTKAAAAAQERVADLEMAARLESTWLDVMDASQSGTEQVTAARQQLFQEYGLDPAGLPAAEVVERIRGRLIAQELVAGMDGWATGRRIVAGPADPLAAKLRAVAEAADPDPWSRRVREVTLDGTADQMAALSVEIPVEIAPQTAVVRLGLALKNAGRGAEVEALLRRAVRAHPDHVRPPFTLADSLQLSPSEAARVEALGYYRVVLALRPRSPAALLSAGVCLTDYLGRPAEGAESFRDAIRLRPDDTLARTNLAVALRKQGKQAEAVAAAREAVAVTPNVVTYYSLGVELKHFGQKVESAEAYRAAVGFEARSSADLFARANALSALGRRAEAIAGFRDTVRQYPTLIHAHVNLGNELAQTGAVDEAMTAYREALRHNPASATAHNGLGNQLRRLGQMDEALAAHREAVRGQPDEPVYHHNLALVLDQLGRADEAIAEIREAIRLKPTVAEEHYILGNLLNRAGRPDEAVVAYREAIRLKPGFAEAHCNLAGVLRRKGLYAESLELYRRGHELGSKTPNWVYPSARWVEDSRRLVALGGRVEAYLTGTGGPADPADTVLVAAVAARRQRFARAAELFRTALAAAPALTDARANGWRYDAACAAARAGCGADAAGLDDAARAGWRQQAAAWLRADLAGWAQQAAGSPEDRRKAQSRMRHWLSDADLAGVREEAKLADLPAAERTEWRQLWAEARAILAKASAPPGEGE